MPSRRVMLDHVTIGVSDLARSRDFYERALAPLGFDRTSTSDVLPSEIEFGSADKFDFAISTDYDVGAPLHLAFAADSVEQVHAFHAAALAAGGREHGPPGPRPHYGEGYYGAFVLDPDGHTSRPSSTAEREAHARASSPSSSLQLSVGEGSRHAAKTDVYIM